MRIQRKSGRQVRLTAADASVFPLKAEPPSMAKESETRSSAATTLEQNLSEEALKESYITYHGIQTTDRVALQTITLQLFRLGVARRMLIHWGIEAGRSESFMRSWVSRVLCAAGFRTRQKGAGRKPNPEVRWILELLRNHFGAKRVRRLLHAASRAAAAEEFDSQPEIIHRPIMLHN